jgi:hypothetical protein
MRRPIELLRLLAFGALLTLGARATTPGTFPLLLGDWTRPGILDHLSHLKATLNPDEGGLRAEAPPGKTGSFFFEVPENSQNWTAFNALAVVVKNNGAQPLKLTLQAEKTVGARMIPPGETARIALPLNNPAFRFPGMKVAPPFEGWGKFQSAHGNSELKQMQVVTVQLQSTAAAKLQIRQVELLPAAKPEGMVDEFGQWTARNWPGKITSDSDLQEPDPALPETADESFDIYGGWTAGPKGTVTGFFHPEKINGNWWLITPLGHPFFSTGVDSINPTAPTPVSGRETMFASLPIKGPLLSHYQTNGDVKSFDFYGANLERKFGDTWAMNWLHETVQRLQAWGFNTIGAWSDSDLAALKKLPYTAIIHLKKQFATVPVDGGEKNVVPDPFDPQYAAALEGELKGAAAHFVKDQWCIGYFVGNEFPWGAWAGPARYAVVLGALSQSGDSPAKTAICAQLATMYSDPKVLSDRWKTRIPSWDSLRNNPWKPPQKWTPELEQDLKTLSQFFADHYFKTVRDALRKQDPNHAYLGCRFAGRTPEFVTAAAKYCDVVSFNWYHPIVDLHDPTLQLFAKLDRPGLIGEFHSGATDRGMFGTGLVWAANQQMRAELYRGYVKSVADSGFLVGCHWFQYADQPLTGRPGDGENFGIGLVSVGDKPYTELTTMAAKVNREVYPWRLNPPPKPETDEGNDPGKLAQTK